MPRSTAGGFKEGLFFLLSLASLFVLPGKKMENSRHDSRLGGSPFH
jgi:hypothetical protein